MIPHEPIDCAWACKSHSRLFVIVGYDVRDAALEERRLRESMPWKVCDFEVRTVTVSDLRAIEGRRVSDFHFSPYATAHPGFIEMYDALHRSTLLTNYPYDRRT